MSLIRAEHVFKRYRLGDRSLWALRNVSMTVEDGVFMAIAGPSGSGKSTLLNLMACIDVPSRGRMIVDGRDTTGSTPDELADLRARTIGFVFQSFNLFPVLTAEENVEYPLLQFPELTREERRARVAEYLDVVELAKHARHRPNELSGGQRQRVAIARALVTHPKIVLADEPTANLDHRTGQEILDLMKGINRTRRATFVFSTHDRKVIAKADRLVRIEDGRIRTLAIKTSSEWVVVRERHRAARARDKTEEAQE